MALRELTHIPLVEAHYVGGKQRPTAIVLSLSETTSDKGAALGIASYHHKANSPKRSHHFIIDEATTYRCVSASKTAVGLPRGALSVHVCAELHEYVPLWEEGTASLVMYRAATLVAELCKTYKIRPVYLDADQYKRWTRHPWRHRGGIYVDVRGTWPSQGFLDDVNAKLALTSK